MRIHFSFPIFFCVFSVVGNSVSFFPSPPHKFCFSLFQLFPPLPSLSNFFSTRVIKRIFSPLPFLSFVVFSYFLPAICLLAPSYTKGMQCGSFLAVACRNLRKFNYFFFPLSATDVNLSAFDSYNWNFLCNSSAHHIEIAHCLLLV